MCCFKNLRFLTFKVFWVVVDSPLRFCSWDNIHWYRHWSGGFRHKSVEQYRQTSSSAQYCLGPSQKPTPHWNLYSIAIKSHTLGVIVWALTQYKNNTTIIEFILLSAALVNMPSAAHVNMPKYLYLNIVKKFQIGEKKIPNSYISIFDDYVDVVVAIKIKRWIIWCIIDAYGVIVIYSLISSTALVSDIFVDWKFSVVAQNVSCFYV